MNRDAIFSDGTEEYRSPMEPKPGQKVTVRIRVLRDEKVHIYFLTQRTMEEMHLERQTSVFDYYAITIQLSYDPVDYIFQLAGENDTCFFDRYSVSEEPRWGYAFRLTPGFETPDWTKGAVMYQILVDRFANGEDDNDVEDREYHYINTYSKRIRDWNAMPEEFDVCNFYGGDLEGVRQKLYYLKSLGVEVIYFNPIFVSPSNHKYDTEDYDYVDPHYAKIVSDGGEVLEDGDYNNSHATKYIRRVTDLRNLEASNEFFAQFVEEAHGKGIRVILDGVFNHCGSFNKWLDREKIYKNASGFEPGAYHTEDSPYNTFFDFQKDGKWPDNNAYDGWWGHDTLPKLNYEGSLSLCEYILSIGRKWVSPPFNADGWRLDVAADLGHSETFNHLFWRRFRDEVKAANPNAVILAEHYGDARNWLVGDQWDTIMNYDAFMEPVSFFLTGMEKHSDRFEEDAVGNGSRFELTMRHAMTAFLTPSLHCAMNQLSNHDHSRFLTRTNHKVGRVKDLGSAAASEGINFAVMKQAVVMQFTWPGAPTLYYGDEAGLCGFTDPDNRRTYPWGSADYELVDFHRDMIMLHKVSPAIRYGAFMFLKCEKNLVSYARFTRDERVIVVVHTGNDRVETDIPVWMAEVPKECMIETCMTTYPKGYSIMPVKMQVTRGMLHLDMPGDYAVVLRHGR